MYILGNFHDYSYASNYKIKKWRTAIFIRHICGERKNTLGHRWTKVSHYLSHLISRADENDEEINICVVQTSDKSSQKNSSQS